MKRIIIFILGLVAILVGLMINVQFSNGTEGIAKINSFELQQPSFSQEGIANGIRFQFDPIKRRKRTTERFETEKKIQQASSKAKKEKQINEMKARENLLSSPCMPDRIIPCVRNSMQQIIQQTYNEETTQNTTVGESEPVQNQFSNSMVSLPTENQTAIINSQCSIWIKEENSLEALRQAKQLVEMRIKELEPLATKDLPVEAEEMRDTTNSIKSPTSSAGTEETPKVVRKIHHEQGSKHLIKLLRTSSHHSKPSLNNIESPASSPGTEGTPKVVTKIHQEQGSNHLMRLLHTSSHDSKPSHKNISPPIKSNEQEVEKEIIDEEPYSFRSIPYIDPW